MCTSPDNAGKGGMATTKQHVFLSLCTLHKQHKRVRCSFAVAKAISMHVSVPA
jgi:hypothetical protein